MAPQEVTRPVFMPIIIGTPRQGRLTEPAANFVPSAEEATQLQLRSGALLCIHVTPESADV